jgi:hypothetical protein
VVLDTVVEPSSIDSESEVVTLSVTVSETLTVVLGDGEPDGDSLLVSLGVTLCTGLADDDIEGESVTEAVCSLVGVFLVGVYDTGADGESVSDEDGVTLLEGVMSLVGL